MNNRILTAVVLGLVIVSGLCFAASTTITKKYWQDVVLRPNQAWIESYGYNGEAVLGFNVRSLLVADQAMTRSLAAVQAELKELRACVAVISDPNHAPAEKPTRSAK